MILEQIWDKLPEDEFCKKNDIYYIVSGMVFDKNTKISDMEEKIKKRLTPIDWKAASHGLRSFINYLKLIEIGEYKYPFVYTEELLLRKIKSGNVSWNDYEEIFDDYYRKIEEKYTGVKSYFDPKKSISIIKSFY